MKKKFLVICLSILMLFSTLMLCGFSRPTNIKTALPSNGGYVSTINFDTSLTSSEIDDIFSSVIFMPNPLSQDTSIYLVCIDSTGYCLFVSKANIDDSITIMYGNFNTFDFNAVYRPGNWLTNSIVFNNQSLSTFSYQGYDVTVGRENALLVDLIYMPSVNDYEKEPSSNFIWSGTPVSTDYVNTIYFNTNITSEQFYETIFKAITFVHPDYLTQPYDVILCANVYQNIYAYDYIFISYTYSNKNIIIYYQNGNDLQVIFEADENSVITPLQISQFNFNGPVQDVDNAFNYNQFFNNYVQDVISSTPFTFEEFSTVVFPRSFLSVFGQIFTNYVPMLAAGVVNMFAGLFVIDGSLSIFGTFFVILFAVSLVSSIFYTVYRIFKNKNKNKL